MNTFVKSLLKCSSVYAMLLLLTSSFVYAEQSIVSKIIDLKPQFTFSRTSVEPIIEYRLNHSMLAEQDPEPLLQVFGNGLVKVHKPVYMKNAGDYELMLDTDEVNELLVSLSDNGVMDFNPDAARDYKKKVDNQRRQSGAFIYEVSDSSETHITIRLDSYQKNKTAGKITNMRHDFIWNNLSHDSRQYPQSMSIQGAYSGLKRMQSLMMHSELRRKN